MPRRNAHLHATRYLMLALLMFAGMIAGAVIFAPAVLNLAMLGEALSVLLLAIIVLLWMERRILLQEQAQFKAALRRAKTVESTQLPQGKAFYRLYLHMAASEDADFIGVNESIPPLAEYVTDAHPHLH
jgi:hypothetical protein